MALLLLVGTTNGLWEIGATPTRRLAWTHQHVRRVLESKAVAALTDLPDGGAVAAISDGKLWQRAPGQRWRRYTIGVSPPADKQEQALTTALAAGIDARLWRGTTPVSLWTTSLIGHAERAWQQCATLAAQPEARQWWGPCDPATPLVTAIAPDPRDAQAVTVAVAVGGVYHTPDGGLTWQAQHSGIAPLVRQDSDGYDAHRNVLSLARHPSFPALLYAMTESAIYRADTTSAMWTWEDITPPHARAVLELPGQVTPATHERDTAFAVAPLADDETRCTLWQTCDGGATWREYAGAPVLPVPAPALSGALPAVIIAVSRVAPEHIALITPDGDVYLTATSGAATHWRHAATGLGSVTCACWAER